jgi:hypothetical protein
MGHLASRRLIRTRKLKLGTRALRYAMQGNLPPSTGKRASRLDRRRRLTGFHA